MDWDEFEARVKRAVPLQELKPKRCWIAVLNHKKQPRHDVEEMDFVWMIGHSKISVQKIHETYQKRNDGLDFELTFRDSVVDRNHTIKNFLAPDGVLVVFLARPSSTAAQQLSEAPDRLSTGFDAQICEASAGPSPMASRVKEEPVDNGTTFPSKERTATPVGPALAQKEPSADQSRETPQDRGEAIPGQLALGHPQTSASDQTYASRAPKVHFSEGQMDSDHLNIFDRTLSGPHDHRASAAQPQPQVSSYESAIPHRSPNPQDSWIKAERRSPPVFHHMDEETQASFDPESFFNREASPEQDSQEATKLTDRSVREIIAQEDPFMLEAGVTQSIKILQSLKSSFSRYARSSPDAVAWHEAIDKLIPQAERKRTIVGVVGNTGAGKSSVINAMLDEERLVPTNCMRACTAVVTEMSWNTSTDRSSRYRGEIEFIEPADWEKELGTLLKEFLTESGGVSRDVVDQNTDAGIAWAKFHSVYPRRTRDSLSECTVKDLMADKAVLAVLGTTKKINTSFPQSFYYQLQRYVDSKEKVSAKDKDKEKQKKANEIEYWPLIKKVKIYVRAAALSTGAVIVDLPGVHDSNAARAAVAQGYMKQCTGLWIVAPINRAVDDKAAKTLLGESFKRQLKYDGGFSSVTFICSKTDDISITEAIDTLGLEDQAEEFYEQQRRYEREIGTIKEKIEELLETRKVYKSALYEAARELDEWEKLREKFDDGKRVYAPVSKSNKRKKKQTKSDYARKRQQKDSQDDDFIVSDDEETETESESDSDDDEVQAPRKPLNESEIKEKIKELRESRKTARRDGLEYKYKIDGLQPQIRELRDKIAAVKAEISHICIAGRNEYSKTAIQQDFSAGIKELDQENAAEDEEHFNPDEELRDYDEVAKSLPVFCVSSRAYQKLCGRLKKDDNVPGFKSAEETEMPQLQAHCMKLTEAGRVQTARSFLLSVCQQLTTLSLWASDDGSGLKMTDDDKRKQFRYLEKRLKELERGLEEAVRSCLNVMKKEMNDQIFNRYPELINEAIEAAPDTVQKWGVKAEGGLSQFAHPSFSGTCANIINSVRNLQSGCPSRRCLSIQGGRISRFQCRFGQSHYQEACNELGTRFPGSSAQSFRGFREGFRKTVAPLPHIGRRPSPHEWRRSSQPRST